MQRLACLIFFAGLWSASLLARPLTPAQVPAPLKPWIEWVLEERPEHYCPFQYDSLLTRRCLWPAHLNFNLNGNKGYFSGTWWVYGESWATLPGDNRHWPQNVHVNGQPALVMDRGGVPGIWLAMDGRQGTAFKITGEFFWDSLPASLTVPVDTGLIQLSRNGEAVATPFIHAGQLWLKAGEAGQAEPGWMENSVDIQVFRKITDTVPMQVLTRLLLKVSGDQREITLPNVMPAQFLPLAVDSVLPARVGADGGLRVQLQPGVWELDLLSRSTQDVTVLPLPAVPATLPEVNWPKTEIWVFAAQPAVRLVEIDQLSAIDASQTNLPDSWRHLPAYSLSAGQAMTLTVIRRGDPDPDPNRLDLNRTVWLDFDGSAYTVNDRMTGTMNRGWRLNALPVTQVGKVSLDGANQLVTVQPGTNKQGVEVRQGQLALVADSRMLGEIGHMSAGGWEQTFNSVRIELNLPPGWQLLAAYGVDNVPDSWLAHWTLLDLFLVLLAALAVARLWGYAWGGLALITLVLIWHEPGAPHWVWLHILAATALLRVLPTGRLATLLTYYRYLAWLALVAIALPFMVEQVRIGLYPQLAPSWPALPGLESTATEPEGRAMIAGEPTESADDFGHTDRAELEAHGTAPLLKKTDKAEAAVVSGPPEAAAYQYPPPAPEVGLERVDPHAKVQTGPGLPYWQWRKAVLAWNAPVDAKQTVSLWYLPPSLALLVNFLRVMLTALLVFLLFGEIGKGLSMPFRPGYRSSGWLGLALLPLLSLLSLAPVDKAQAAFPSPDLLAELKSRLAETPPPECANQCASIQRMVLTLDNQRMTIDLTIHAQALVYLPIPAEYGQWFPSQVLINGQQTAALFRTGTALSLALPVGVHRVTLLGIAPKRERFTLPLPLKPKHVAVRSSGWTVLGVRENGEADEQLQFTRSGDHQPGQSGWEPGGLPPFARVERTLYLGVDWRVHTRVVRVSPADSALVLQVPILPGEAVTSPGIRVKEARVEVNLPAQQQSLDWQSSLEKTPTVVLTAASTEQWTEVWRAVISPIWHVETSGLAMIRLDHTEQWLPEWHPWPGETVTLALSRPEAVAGQTLTVDSSQIRMQPSQRSRNVTLDWRWRSSLGGQHSVILPEQAVLQSLVINGQARPFNLQGRRLVVPVDPGEQAVSLNWQEAVPLATVTHTPEINLGIGSVNSRIHVSLGEDRWVLFAFGPKWGPAVLFWSVLLVIAIVSVGLGQTVWTPLRHGQWFLLLLGLSQIPMPLAGLVVAWLLALGWRARQTNAIRYFNGIQLALVGLTLAALGVLFSAVAQGLLQAPEMGVSGNQSSALYLNWYQDRSEAVLPMATIISVPLMVYRLLMLAWSLWLAVALLNWLRWGWGCFASGGLWRKAAPVKTLKQAAADTE